MSGTAFGDAIVGLWNESAKKLTFYRLMGALDIGAAKGDSGLYGLSTPLRSVLAHGDAVHRRILL